MKKKFKKITYLSIIGVMLLLLVGGCGGQQPTEGGQEGEQSSSDIQPIVIRWSYDAPQGGSMATVPEKFKELVDADESLKGRVEVQLYPASQLYKPQEALDAVMRGDVEFIFLGHWYLSSLSPKVSVIDLPFLFNDVESLNKFLDTPEAQEMWAPLEEKGIKVAAAAATGSYSVISKSKPVVLPQDVKGLKIRSTGDGSIVWQKLGASPVNLPAGDVYVSMQRNTIDAADLGPISIEERAIYEVGKYYLDGMVHATLITQIVNKAFWDNLPADIQDRLWQHLKEAEQAHREIVPQLEREYVEKMKAEGVQVHTMTPEERQQWVEAVQPVYDELAPKIGADYIERVKATQQ